MTQQSHTPLIGKQYKVNHGGKVFTVVKEYLAAGFIPSVVGVSHCGGFKACTRIVDMCEV